MTKFQIYVSQDDQGMYFAECPSIPGCHAIGRTEDEVQQRLAECITARLKAHRPVPAVTTRDLEVAG